MSNELKALKHEQKFKNASSSSRVMGSNPQAQIYELRVQIYEVRVQIHELPVQIHELPVQILELQVQIHEFKNHLINENSSKQP